MHHDRAGDRMSPLVEPRISGPFWPTHDSLLDVLYSERYTNQMCPGSALCARAGEPALPQLVRQVPAVYPPAALAEGARTEVLLELDVTATGEPSAVRVVGSGGPAFDAAAIQAARSFLFSPGTDADGNPVSATILVPGRVRAVAGPAAVGRGPGPTGRDPPTARWRRRGLRVGRTADPRHHRPRRSASGRRARRRRLDRAHRCAGLPRPARPDHGCGWLGEHRAPVFLVEDRPWDTVGAGVSEELVVVGERETPEVTERTLSREEARYLPGTAGDIVRVVQNLPGVARPPLGIGRADDRGTGPKTRPTCSTAPRSPTCFTSPACRP